MKYDFEKIDSSDPKRTFYKLHVDFNAPRLCKYERCDLQATVNGLQQSLPFLFDDRMTFDAETLLGSAWCTEVRADHNRTLGAILRVMVDLNVLPLIRVPKRKGSRVRFRIHL